MKHQATETKGPKLVTNNQNGHIDFTAALDQLEQLLPENRLLVTDGGRFMTEVWSRISVPHPKISFIAQTLRLSVKAFNRQSGQQLQNQMNLFVFLLVTAALCLAL